MFLRKSTIVILVALMAMGMAIANVSYAEKHLDHVGSEGVGGPASPVVEDEMNKDKGNRPADIGFVTKEEHNSIRRFIVANIPNAVTQSSIDGNFGEQIITQTMKGFKNTEEGRRAAGHFSIRGQMVNGRNVVYVTVDEDAYMANPLLAQHEVEEYIQIAQKAVDMAGLSGKQITQEEFYGAKEALANWIDNKAKEEEATAFLLGVHKSVPTQLGATERDLMPDTLAYLKSMRGVRDAAGLGNQASKEEIVVIGAAQVLNNKAAFDSWLLKDGAKFSVSIIATTQEEYEGVKDYERYRESSVRVKVAAAEFGEWARQLEPDQKITISDKTQLDNLLEDLKRNPAGVRLNALENLTPGLSQAIAVGV